MSRDGQTHVLTVLFPLMAACVGNGASTGSSQGVVTDTLGFRYDVNCSTGLCVLAPQNPANSPVSCSSGSGTDYYVLAIDPLLAIYALRVPSSGQVQLNASDPSRPVACTSDTDCMASGITMGTVVNTYTCQFGLCQLQRSCTNGICTPWDGVLLTYDVLTLCQADIPWPSPTGGCPYLTSPTFAHRIAEVADVCGSSATCASVPPDCRQPTSAPVDAGLSAPGIDGGP